MHSRKHDQGGVACCAPTWWPVPNTTRHSSGLLRLPCYIVTEKVNQNRAADIVTTLDVSGMLVFRPEMVAQPPLPPEGCHQGHGEVAGVARAHALPRAHRDHPLHTKDTAASTARATCQTGTGIVPPCPLCAP